MVERGRHRVREDRKERARGQKVKKGTRGRDTGRNRGRGRGREGI